jgi:hypothetical protein
MNRAALGKKKENSLMIQAGSGLLAKKRLDRLPRRS